MDLSGLYPQMRRLDFISDIFRARILLSSCHFLCTVQALYTQKHLIPDSAISPFYMEETEDSESSHPWGLKALAHHLFVHCLCQMLFRPEAPHDSDKAQSEAWKAESSRARATPHGSWNRKNKDGF